MMEDGTMVTRLDDITINEINTDMILAPESAISKQID